MSGASDARWLFSARTDVLAFLGTAVASAALAVLAPRLGIGPETPPWAWLLLVVGIDVAHVWSTVFRVYLDAEEVRRRRLLYTAAPLIAYGLGVAAYSVSADAFWRVLAYVAVWHFIRQQEGWMVLYGRRAGSTPLELRLDRAAIYAATLGPVVWWHAHLPRPFWWFREGDFAAGLPAWCGTAALAVHGVVLGAWLVAATLRRRLHVGKALLLLATWLAWFGGIVLARSDFAFTVMNVALHGVPYLVLQFRYSRGRQEEGGGYGRLAFLARAGLPAFLGLLFGLAFLEEGLWDRLVWHEHATFFGASGLELHPLLLTLVVPLLALPQATHYLLDGFIWRTKENPRLTERLSWAVATRSS